MNKNVNFFGEIQEELKKISWPSREQTLKLTTIIIAISLIVSFYLGIIDVSLTKILEVLMKAK